MDLIVWENFSKKSNSTKRPEINSGRIVDVKIKNSTSLENPIFLIDGIDLAVNYCYFNAIGRYYFITDIILGNNNIYELHCVSDLLATYKPVIGELTTFISRCSDSSKYNVMLPDSALSNENGISNLTSSSTYVSLSDGLGYIIRIVGRDSTGGVGTFYFPNVTALQNAFGAIWGDLENIDPLNALATLVQLYAFNPSQYIINVYTTPIGASVYGRNSSTEKVYFGGHESNITADRINTAIVKMVTNEPISIPTSIYSDFRKYDPAFSKYSLYIPTVGVVPLSCDVIRKSLTISVSADLTAGDLFFILKADGDIIATYNSNVYNSFNFASMNSGQIVGDVAGVATDMVTGNVIGFASDVVRGVRNAISPNSSVISTQGGTGCVAHANEVVLTCQQKTSADFPTAIFGRPCCKNLKIGTLSGYIKCDNASIDVAGYASDKETINSFLNNGFYYE